ncbi:enoyl-CoA hydratase/isomerase family protein [Cuniculiplasma sp. SKW4]|uniref:enoyl-CoA hydratase/isomerase family protein n=1 Tax=Cuniculiplasma sp. SKW4 TaxID=3400171 RepID=UPI003FD45725
MKNINVEEDGRILKIMINREKSTNPLDIETIEEIGEALKDENRIGVIYGNNRAFSAGADISLFLNLSPGDAYNFAQKGHDVMNFIQTRKMPVIAAIHGFALGGGFELALACDYRIAHPATILGLPEVTLGVLPGFGGTQRLLRLAGESLTFDLISRGKRINAQDALNYGLINEISEEYLKSALSVAKEYESLPIEALTSIKELIRKAPDSGFELEKEYFANLFNTSNQKEGARAFLEKRKANFNTK